MRLKQTLISLIAAAVLLASSSHLLADEPAKPTLTVNEAADTVAVAPNPTGRVVAVKNGWAAIVATSPLHVGDKFLIRSQRSARVVDPLTDEVRHMPVNRPVGVIAIGYVTAQGGTARLPRGTIVAVGDTAELTTSPVQERIFFPPLWKNMIRLQASLTPFLPVRALGFGMLAAGSLDYYLPIAMKIGVEASPFGLVAVKGGTGVVSELRGKIGYAGDYFELTLEPGAAVERLGGSRFALGYGFRLGSLDGLNLTFQNSYYIINDQFEFGSAKGEIQVPVHRRVTLSLIGGGSASWGYGMGGVRTFVRGNGGPGTVIITAHVGAAGVGDQTRNEYGAYERVSGIGPAVAVGIDARF